MLQFRLRLRQFAGTQVDATVQFVARLPQFVFRRLALSVHADEFAGSDPDDREGRQNVEGGENRRACLSLIEAQSPQQLPDEACGHRQDQGTGINPRTIIPAGPLSRATRISMPPGAMMSTAIAASSASKAAEPVIVSGMGLPSICRFRTERSKAK